VDLSRREEKLGSVRVRVGGAWKGSRIRLKLDKRGEKVVLRFSRAWLESEGRSVCK
jgi:hypothetical protein